MGLPSTAYIRELGPREGFQTLTKIFPAKQKLELINLLSRTGVPENEVTSFVRSDRVPQMADAEEVASRLTTKEGVRYTALYLNKKGFERAAACPALSVQGWIYSALSARFLRDNNNLSFREILEQLEGWISAFKERQVPFHGVMISTAFGSNHEGRFAVEELLTHAQQIMERLAAAGAAPKELSLADTMGWGVPEQVRRAVGELRSRYPQLQVSLHLHDTRGSGLANIYAALLEGVSVFDCSVGGLGGCPFAPGAAGNVCTEDVVYMCEECGVRTGIDLESYLQASRYAESIAGPLPGKLLRGSASAHRKS